LEEADIKDILTMSRKEFDAQVQFHRHRHLSIVIVIIIIVHQWQS
jgi:hypothetical protein